MTLEGKDYCKYVFKNGSYFDNIAARESSRGKRRHGGLVVLFKVDEVKIVTDVIKRKLNKSA